MQFERYTVQCTGMVQHQQHQSVGRDAVVLVTLVGSVQRYLFSLGTLLPLPDRHTVLTTFYALRSFSHARCPVFTSSSLTHAHPHCRIPVLTPSKVFRSHHILGTPCPFPTSILNPFSVLCSHPFIGAPTTLHPRYLRVHSIIGQLPGCLLWASRCLADH